MKEEVLRSQTEDTFKHVCPAAGGDDDGPYGDHIPFSSRTTLMELQRHTNMAAFRPGHYIYNGLNSRLQNLKMQSFLAVPS